MFYGIIIYMYFYDNKKHKLPHIHVQYQEEEIILSIPEGNILEGNLKPNKLKLVYAWLEIHQEELMANWLLAVKGEKVFNIEPLK